MIQHPVNSQSFIFKSLSMKSIYSILLTVLVSSTTDCKCKNTPLWSHRTQLYQIYHDVPHNFKI